MHEHGEPEGQLAPSGEASVVLDVGGTQGAAVIFTTDQMLGSEIEIRTAGSPWEGGHTAVRQRDLRDSIAFAGVFGSLPAGHYQMRVKGGETDRRALGSVVDLTVRGGEVTQMEWPAG
jgi:hypothetical protein